MYEVSPTICAYDYIGEEKKMGYEKERKMNTHRFKALLHSRLQYCFLKNNSPVHLVISIQQFLLVVPTQVEFLRKRKILDCLTNFGKSYY